VCTPGALPAASQEQLSAALAGLMGELLNAALSQQLVAVASGEAEPEADGAGAGAAWARSGANLLLRSLTREEPFLSGGLLPLLPGDAAAALQAIAPRVPAKGVPAAANGVATANGGPPPGASKKKDRSGGGGGADGKGAGPPLPALLRDDKAYLLLSKLVATAAPSGALRDGGALTRLLGWSSAAVRRALEALVHPAGAGHARGRRGDGAGAAEGPWACEPRRRQLAARCDPAAARAQSGPSLPLDGNPRLRGPPRRAALAGGDLCGVRPRKWLRLPAHGCREARQRRRRRRRRRGAAGGRTAAGPGPGRGGVRSR
jgi:hypothetical protein